MKRVSRAQLRGKPLDEDCKIYGMISRYEYGEEDNRCFCFGLINPMYEDYEQKCRDCKAWSRNAEPPKEES